MRTIKCLAILLVTVVPALIFLTPADAARNRNTTGYRGRMAKQLTGRQSSSDAITTIPSFTDSARLMLLPHATQGAWIESGFDSTPETHPSIGSLIGQFDDHSPCNNEIVATTAGRVTLGEDSSRLAFFTGGSSKRLFVINSKKSFTTIWGTGRAGSIAIWFKCGADGTLEQLLDSNSGTTANAGLYVARTAANKLNIITAKASAGNAVYNHLSSTTGVTVDKGWMLAVADFSGASGNLYINNMAGTYAVSEPMTAVNAGADVDATGDLTIGSTVAGGNYWTGSIGPIAILPTAMSGAQRTEFLAFNPVRTNAKLARKIAANNLPTDYSGLRMWLDGAGTTYFYTDTAKTTPASADGDQIRAWACRAPTNVNRDALGTGAAGTYPRYKPTQTGGVGGLLYDGVDENLVMQGIWPRAGNFHLFMVVKNNDATNGSRYVSQAGGAMYLVQTGVSYSGNSSNGGNSYALIHTSGGVASGYGTIGNPTGLNVLEVKRDGQYSYTRVNGVGDYAVSPSALPANSGNYFQDIGGSANASWFADGLICEKVLYTNVLPVRYANRIAAYLGAKWSVANMGVAQRERRQVQVASLLPRRQQAEDLFFVAP